MKVVRKGTEHILISLQNREALLFGIACTSGHGSSGMVHIRGVAPVVP